MAKRKAESPVVYVIAGPNGSGKTTFASQYLPRFVRCREFLNADLIAAGLSPFAPETQNARAGRLLLERIRELTRQRADFGFETTLAGRTYSHMLDKLKTDGYRVCLFFLWLPRVEMALARVKNRVEQGGHSVPADAIRRRFGSGLRNLFKLYAPIVDSWWLYDGSQLPPRRIATSDQGHVIVSQKRLYQTVLEQSEEPDEEAC